MSGDGTAAVSPPSCRAFKIANSEACSGNGAGDPASVLPATGDADKEVLLNVVATLATTRSGIVLRNPAGLVGTEDAAPIEAESAFAKIGVAPTLPLPAARLKPGLTPGRGVVEVPVPRPAEPEGKDDTDKDWVTLSSLIETVLASAWMNSDTSGMPARSLFTHAVLHYRSYQQV